MSKKKLQDSKELKGRRPWERLDQQLKEKIVREILTGLIGYREASRKYKISRMTIAKWMEKQVVKDLLSPKTSKPLNLEMGEKKIDKQLLDQVKALTRQLEEAKLKIAGLETMIEVAESDCLN